MEYPKTVHAGGAKKNRLFNDIISLDAGSYTLHYETDDSHNFNNWNADKPDEDHYWGIMVLKEVSE